MNSTRNQHQIKSALIRTNPFNQRPLLKRQALSGSAIADKADKTDLYRFYG